MNDDNDTDYNILGGEDDDTTNADTTNTNANINANPNRTTTSVVRYLHIVEIPNQYTIGIFVFGPNQCIPLHDHPEMCVVSRILYGDLQRLSLDLDRRDDDDKDDDDDEGDDATHLALLLRAAEVQRDEAQLEAKQKSDNTSLNKIEPISSSSSSTSTVSSSWFTRSKNWFRSSNSSSNNTRNNNNNGANTTTTTTNFPAGTKIAYKNGIDTLEAPEVAVLYPYEGNLHEFVAGPYGAAVLDVLVPPYSSGEEDEHNEEPTRDCTFYTIRDIPATLPTTKQQQQQQQQQERILPNSLVEKEPCLIIPTGQPETFHCISGRYRNLGEASSSSSDESMRSSSSSASSIFLENEDT